MTGPWRPSAGVALTEATGGTTLVVVALLGADDVTSEGCWLDALEDAASGPPFAVEVTVVAASEPPLQPATRASSANRATRVSGARSCAQRINPKPPYRRFSRQARQRFQNGKPASLAPRQPIRPGQGSRVTRSGIRPV